MIIKEFLNQIEGSYSKYFTNSKCSARLYKGLGRSIVIDCYLANNLNEVANRIAENDMLSISFWIHNLPKDADLETELPEDAVITNSDKSYVIKPDNTYMAYGRKTLSYRKTAGSAKIIKSLDKFFSNLNKSLKEDIENNLICEKHLELLKEKLI